VGKIAVVLSGGGARGAFQAGALTELLGYFERTGKRINILSGTSVGALNGMSIAQAPDLRAAALDIEQQWKHLTNPDVYKIRGWEIFGLILKFATTRMDLWPTVPGADSLFDNTPLYNKYIQNYFRHDLVKAKRTVDEFCVSLSSLNTGAAYVRSITDEPDTKKAMEYIMASTITTVAYSPVRTTVDDPLIPERLRGIKQLYADGGISNKTPLKSVLHLGGVTEIYVVNTYPSYPNITEHSIRAVYPNVFAMLLRTAVELLPNLYFLRDMQTVKDVNNDLRTYDDLKSKVLRLSEGGAKGELEKVFREMEEKFLFQRGGEADRHAGHHSARRRAAGPGHRVRSAQARRDVRDGKAASFPPCRSQARSAFSPNSPQPYPERRAGARGALLDEQFSLCDSPR
jgi:predicted acylesterase/phospholipase RssA